jgi:two-component system phosphate regulon sensor histidine kinase PhoR
MGAIYNYLKIDIFALSALIFTFSFLFVIIFSFKVLNPIRELAKASRKVALGDFDNKVPIKGNDELSNLASNFNQMTEKLQGYFILAEAQQEQYLRLITSIQTGMIVIDRNGKIIMNNKSFENIIGSNIVQGHEYWEFLSQLDFKDLLETVLKKKKHTNREIEIQNNFYLCSANYIESKNEFVVLFHDISEIKKLENIKRDFVVNVTHELRTPLTAIKGYIETLEDEINDNSESANYIGIIKRHTDRLINIVQDLLTLSEIEQKTSNIELSKVDINILFENMYRIFEQKIQQKGLQFIIKPDKSIPYLKLDSFRIEQVLINLIDNAIKYTDSGYVKLEAVKKGAKIQLIISDTGLGIPKEHHSRLFERFYTVDKSRSRKVGGTGLGLSIVKHIIMLHKGEIYVDSNSGKGTKFIIEIPQKHFKKFI